MFHPAEAPNLRVYPEETAAKPDLVISRLSEAMMVEQRNAACRNSVSLNHTNLVVGIFRKV